jgi:hypothetical protein
LTSDVVGHARFNQRVISPYMPRTLKEALDAERERSGRSRGAVAIAALEHYYEQITADLVESARPPGRFGRPPRPRRQVQDGVVVAVYVSHDAALAIATLAHDHAISVSELITMALSYELDGHFEQAGVSPWPVSSGR